MITTTYTTPKQILIADDLAFTISIKVGNAGIVADANGKKIIKAGSPLSGTAGADILQVRQTVAILDDTATATMVLLHDVDVTAGTENGTAVVTGVIDINKIGYVPAAACQAALTRIVFVKGD